MVKVQSKRKSNQTNVSKRLNVSKNTKRVFCVFIPRVRTAPQVPPASLGRGGLWELLEAAGRGACWDYLVPLCVGSVGSGLRWGSYRLASNHTEQRLQSYC